MAHFRDSAWVARPKGRAGVEAVAALANENGRTRRAVESLLLMFALHTFLLMVTGTSSDLAMASEPFGTTFYYVREAMLAAGLVLYIAFAWWKRTHVLAPRSVDAACSVLTALFAICTLAMQLFAPPAIRAISALVIALLVGVVGGLTYERVALLSTRFGEDATRMLGIIVGCGGALAVVVQYVLQCWLSLSGLLDVLLVVCMGLLVGLVRRMHPAYEKVQDARRSAARGSGAASLACIAVAATCLLCMLPFYEAVMRSQDVDPAIFYEWHRLLLAVGYLAIGAIAYWRGRSAASMAVIVCMMFAIIVSVESVMLEMSPLTTALFYGLYGAVLAWSCVAFMSAAAVSAYPALAASMGRIVIVLVTLSERLIQAVGMLPMKIVLAVSLALMAGAVIAMVRGGLLEPAEKSSSLVPAIEPTPAAVPEPASVSADEAAPAPAAEPPSAPAPSVEERANMLATQCGLTNREQQVLTELVFTEKKNQQIADGLGISRRQLQTHIAHIYQKTGTTTRAGLVMRVNSE